MAKLLQNILMSDETVTLGTKIDALSASPLLIPQEPQMSEQHIEELRLHAYNAGKEAGEQMTQQKMDELQRTLESMLLAIPQALAEARLALNAEIAEIILLITQHYFLERQKDPGALQQQINLILSQINSKQTVALYLHPQDIDRLQKGTIQLDTAHLPGLSVKRDDSLILGGCVIKTEHGVFDASIEKQIDKLKEFLLQIRAGASYASPH